MTAQEFVESRTGKDLPSEVETKEERTKMTTATVLL